MKKPPFFPILFLLLTILNTTLIAKDGEVSMPFVRDWKMIDKLNSYDGDDLGCVFKNGTATFKLWAPRATKVRLLLYDKHDQTVKVGEKDMIRIEKGIWTTVLNRTSFQEITDLKGHFYQYEVTNPGREPKKVLDPYAKSMAAVTVNRSGNDPGATNDFTGKAAIIDPGSTGPEIKESKIADFENREDAIIWEIHIRDFTSDPSIEGELNAGWGTYRAFIDKLPYIKSLGATHILLLPVQAWYYGDETMMKRREQGYSAKSSSYNWGYDPHNYFSPDGAYSENPNDPEARISELKELINAIHNAGMGVILDVVYTHMAKTDFLDDIVPSYYFFQDTGGHFIGGFGNNLAFNRKMVEKLLIDSVKYWFEEYGIDGMRWDMMGDAPRDAVQKAFDAARTINTKTIFIGEGWRTFSGHLDDQELAGKGADQDWMSETDCAGVFSDEFRNEMKSGFGCEGEPRFLTGGARNIGLIFRNIKAQPSNTPATSPGDMVQYIEAHDNMTLFDVIATAIKKDPMVPENDLEIHRRIRLGNLILLTSQGTVFVHAGQEYGRTKQWMSPSVPEDKFRISADASGKDFCHPYFIHDSYSSSDAINMFDWQKATDATKFPTNHRTSEYLKGLIRLRKSTGAFRLSSQDEVNARINLIAAKEIKSEDLLIAYSISAENGAKYYVFINADSVERRLELSNDLTQGIVLCDADRAGIIAIRDPAGFELSEDLLKIQPLSGLVIKVE